jgi:DNA repair protein RecO
MLKSLKGIVLKSIEHTRGDVWIKLLTSSGSIIAIFAAKAGEINSPLLKSTAAFTCGVYEVEDKMEGGFFILKSYKIEQSNAILYQKNPLINFSLMMVGDILIAHYDYLTDDSVNLYTNLYQMLSCFKSTDREFYHNIILVGLKNILADFGLLNDSLTCGRCQNGKNFVAFDIASGGFICKNCFNPARHQKLPPATLTKYYILMKMQFEDVSKFKADKDCLKSLLGQMIKVLMDNEILENGDFYLQMLF